MNYAIDSLSGDCAAVPPPGVLLANGAQSLCTTPYGTVTVQRRDGIDWLSSASPHALVYGAKEMGFERIIEVVALRAVNRLLETGDMVLPDDLLDLTRGRTATFFVGKGYGFLPQHPPYCPLLRAVLLDAAREVAATLPLAIRPRVFGRGTYGAINSDAINNTGDTGDTGDTDGLCDDEKRSLLARCGVDVLGVAGVPTSFLARELELCYAPIGYVTADTPGMSDTVPAEAWETLVSILQRARTQRPLERSCGCGDTMRSTRERGLVGDDWHTWIG